VTSPSPSDCIQILLTRRRLSACESLMFPCCLLSKECFITFVPFSLPIPPHFYLRRFASFSPPPGLSRMGFFFPFPSPLPPSTLMYACEPSLCTGSVARVPFFFIFFLLVFYKAPLPSPSRFLFLPTTPPEEPSLPMSFTGFSPSRYIYAGGFLYMSSLTLVPSLNPASVLSFA